MATVEVSTRKYVSSHWRDPRVHGSWAFRFPTTSAGGPAHMEWFNGTFTQARKLAIARARVVGAIIIEVLP